MRASTLTGTAMHRLAEALLALLAWSITVVTPVTAQSLASDPSGADPLLAGRLGGTRRSFDERYGPAHRSGIDWAYDVPGYGLVQVQFGGDGPDGPALVVTLRSPRPADLPALTPHPADWPTVDASQRALAFVPLDAQLGPLVPINDSVQSQTCRSKALLQAFGAAGSHSQLCQLTYLTPTADTVSFVTISLAGQAQAGPLATPVDPCAGIVEWAQATASRLEEAKRLLDEVATLPNDTAATRLREIAGRFVALADEQRASPVPGQAVTANYHLIAGFTAYGDGLEAAATALTTGNDTAMKEAEALLARAAEAVAQATTAMAEAFTACRLDVATPIPRG